jgi:hypothetical protein
LYQPVDFSRSQGPRVGGGFAFTNWIGIYRNEPNLLSEFGQSIGNLPQVHGRVQHAKIGGKEIRCFFVFPREPFE